MSQTEDVDSQETVAVYAASDQIAAQLMRGVLEAEGIDAAIGEQVTGTLGGAVAVGEGYWAELRVLPEYADRARAAINAYEESGGSMSDAELDAEAMSSSDPGV